MSLRLASATRDAVVNTIGDLLSSGLLKMFTGSRPGSVDSGDTGTHVATCTLDPTAFGSATSGSRTANTIVSDTSAANSGTITQCRIYLNDDTTLWGDVTCGTSAADIIFDNNIIVAGGIVAISGLTLTQP